MKRSIGTPLALFGLLLAAAMVCTTSAQGPKPESPAVEPAAPVGTTTELPGPFNTRPEPRPGEPAGDHSVLPGRTREIPPTRSRSANPSTTSSRAMPLVVGRYQAVSHNGKLILIDTATGECYLHEGSGWRTFAPPIEPNGILAPRGPATAPELPVPGGVSSNN
jgi:hypothetical protein